MADIDKKLRELMRGRNGADDIALVSVTVAILLAVINLFAKTRVLSALGLALVIYGVWRTLSKDTQRRARENAAFVRRLGPVRRWVQNPKAAFEEARSFKHAKCPNCGRAFACREERARSA
jgi:hypothetical protein